MNPGRKAGSSGCGRLPRARGDEPTGYAHPSIFAPVSLTPKSRLPQPAKRLLDRVQVHTETPSNGGERLTTVAEVSSLSSNHLIDREREQVADLEITRNMRAGSKSFRPSPIPLSHWPKKGLAYAAARGCGGFGATAQRMRVPPAAKSASSCIPPTIRCSVRREAQQMAPAAPSGGTGRSLPEFPRRRRNRAARSRKRQRSPTSPRETEIMGPGGAVHRPRPPGSGRNRPLNTCEHTPKRTVADTIGRLHHDEPRDHTTS